MRTAFIINPASGSADETGSLEASIRAHFPEADLRETKSRGDGEKFAREAVESGCGLVVAAGGDGTLNEVVNGLATDFAACALGLLPLGTGNDFARSVNVPADVEEALALLAPERLKPLDVVQVTGEGISRYLINVSAGGFSGMVDEKLTEEMKQTWGPLAYLRSAIAALPELIGYDTEIIFDDTEDLRISSYNIVIANGRFVAGGIPVAPEAVLDDGLVDLVLVPSASIPQLAVLVPSILRGSHLQSDLITFRRARKISVQSQPGMWFNADGELIGNQSFTFEVLPRVLRVCVGNGVPV